MTPTRDDDGADVRLAPYFQELERELVRAGERQLRRRNRRRTLVAAAVAVVVAGGVIAVSSSLRSEPVRAADVEVQREGDERFRVSFDRDELDATTIVEQLRDAGLNVHVVETPTGSSRVGRVVAVGSDPNDVAVADADGMVVYEGTWGATIDVAVGVESEGSFDAFTDALLPGEPLACDSWVGQAATDLLRIADAKGITVTFRDEQLLRQLATDELTGYVVQSAIAVAQDEVRVSVVRGDATPNPDPACR
jgi:hypothetical protein